MSAVGPRACSVTTLEQNLSMLALNPRARLLLTGLLIAGAALAVFGLLDAFVLVVAGEHQVADFRPYYAGAEALLRGETLYPPVDDATLGSGRAYVYPPLTAILAVPLSLLSVTAAEATVLLLGIVAVVATLLAVGVRDWRCYAIAFCWAPVASAVQLGNVTVFLGLAAALAWRFRNRDVPVAICVGVTLAVKFFLWPLLIWLMTTRRFRGSLLASAVGVVVFAGSWAVIGFDGMTEYPDILRRLQGEVELGSYSTYVALLHAGAPSWLARGVWLALGLTIVALFLIVDRRGADRTAFVLAIAAALALTPIVWMHYFELLLVAVAVARPRFGLVWLVPVPMWFVSPASYAETFEVFATLGLVAMTFVLALRASLASPERWNAVERRLSPTRRRWRYERLGALVRGEAGEI